MKSIGTYSGPAGMLPFTIVDIAVSNDNKIMMRMRRDPEGRRRGDGMTVVVIDGDEQLLLDMILQLVGGLRIVRERQER